MLTHQIPDEEWVQKHFDSDALVVTCRILGPWPSTFESTGHRSVLVAGGDLIVLSATWRTAGGWGVWADKAKGLEIWEGV